VTERAEESLFVDEERDCLRRGERATAHYVQVEADAESRVFAREADGFSKGRGVREERRGGEDARPVRFGDARVHRSGKTEVVGVDDEAAGRVNV
jgi:hypothetical protein